MKKTAAVVLTAASLMTLPVAAADLGISHRHHRHAHSDRHVYYHPAPEFYGYSRYSCGLVRAPGRPVFSGPTYIGNTRARRVEALAFGASEASVCGGRRMW